jgi:predicted TIM-barrel fold metal-dependent hydrolase
MLVIDAQVHVYERNHPGRPWMKEIHGPPEVTGEDMIKAMDSVGVDGALVVSAYTTYKFDPSYAVEACAAHPDRFAMITPVDPSRDDIVDEISDWAAKPGAVGVRLLLPSEALDVPQLNVKDRGVDRVMTAAARFNMPVCLQCSGELPRAGSLAASYPDTQLVVDHLGLQQPVKPPPLPNPFADLPALLELARYPNLALKVTGAATLSRTSFPFADLHQPLSRIFDAFGFDRCMWGTDWTRATALVSYADAVAAFRDGDWLSVGERAALMGETLERVFGWRPAVPSTAIGG